jgi:AraC family transcriptional regulator
LIARFQRRDIHVRAKEGHAPLARQRILSRRARRHPPQRLRHPGRVSPVDRRRATDSNLGQDSRAPFAQSRPGWEGKMNDDAYGERFARVLDYIEQHLGEELSIERLGREANFSKFHFHRQFSAYVGVSVARYVQILRLKRASRQLVFQPAAKIINIAFEAGFETPESFSRAFKREYGQTPSQFRSAPAWKQWRETYRFAFSARSRTMDVKIVDLAEIKVAALEHRGPLELVNDTARKFIEWRKESRLSPKDSSRTFGIAYDNPDTTEPQAFRFDICGEVSADVPANPQRVVTKAIPRGRCAVVRHLGSHDRIGECAYYLYRDWLPGSGEELRDFPLFFHYLNLITETPEPELVTDIYLPLK